MEKLITPCLINRKRRRQSLFAIFSSLLLSTPIMAQSLRYEAEDLPASALAGGAHIRSTRNPVNTADYPDHANYSGTGFVDGFDASTAASATFTVSVAQAGRYYVTLRYSNGRWGGVASTNLNVTATGPSALAVTKSTVLNSYRDPTQSPNQYNWETWDSKTELFTLEAGTTTITYSRPTATASAPTPGIVNLDYIWLTKYEANGTIPASITTGNQLLVKKLVSIPAFLYTPPATAGNPNPTPYYRQPLLNNFAFTGNQLFASEQVGGKIYEIVDNGSGGKTSRLFFDVKTTMGTFNRVFNTANEQHGGLRGVAFHPDFNVQGMPGYHKLYTAVMEDRPTSAPVNVHQSRPRYLSDVNDPNPCNGVVVTTSSCGADGVILEWTYDPAALQAFTPREILRIGMPVNDHPIKQIDFNPYLAQGTTGYDWLYIAHGDGSHQSATAGGGQCDNALGKILRIDPHAGSLVANDYGAPAPAFPSWNTKEIYALGFRNPHTFSFWKDNAGVSHLMVGEAGRDNIEEVNLVEQGKNYGWPLREGSFEHYQVELQGEWDGDPTGYDDYRQGIVQGVAPLVAPRNTTEASYVYPAAQWGHKGAPGTPFGGQAMAGGYVHTGPDGAPRYLFADFANSGRIFSSSVDEMLRTTRQLSPGQSPAALTQAAVQEFTILYDHDNNVLTPSLPKYSMRDVLYDDLGTHQPNRADLRFGHGPITDNTIYIMNKVNGWVYQAAIVPASGITSVYEAEDAVLSAPDNMVGSAYWDYRGTGYAENLTSIGRSVSFTNVTVPTAGAYLVDLRYSAGAGPGSVNLYVNSSTAPMLVSCPATVPPTGSADGWNGWGHQVTLVTLQAGINTLRYSCDTGTLGYINMDYISVRPNTYEAEDAVITNTNGAGAITGAASIGTGHTGYRGSGFVENIWGSDEAVRFTVQIPAAGTYDVSLRYSAAGTGGLALLQDGSFVQNLSFSTGAWNAWAYQTVPLTFTTSGTHSIEYRHTPGTAGMVNLDFLEIGKSPCTPSIYMMSAMPIVHNPCGDMFPVSVGGGNLGADYQWYINGIHYPAYDGLTGIGLLLDYSRPSATVVVKVSSECVGTGGSTAQISLGGNYVPCGSGPVQVARTSASGGVAMYPNPANTYVVFNADMSAGNAGKTAKASIAENGQAFQVALYDGRGKLAWEGKTQTGQLTLDTSQFPIGFYHVVVTQNGKATRSNLSIER